MRSYLTALMLLATLGLVSCGGGNDGASTGTPVVAQVTVALAGEVSSCGSIPIVYARSGAYYSKLNQCRSSYEVLKAPQPGQTGIGMMCIVLPPPEPVAGAVGACQVGMIQTVIAALPVWSPTANGGCGESSSYGGTGPVLNAAQQQACGEAFVEAYNDEYNASQCSALGGNLWWEICTVASWSPTANGGCANSSSFGGSGPALNAGGLGRAEMQACGWALSYAGGTSKCSALGGNWQEQTSPGGGGTLWCNGGAANLKGGLINIGR
jgi:hypothetical protein